MLGYIRNSIFSEVFCGLLGLYLLNISIDAVDSTPSHIAEDLSINDQESIIELVIEKILGYGDVFKEHDDPDTEDQSKKNSNSQSDKWFSPVVNTRLSICLPIFQKKSNYDHTFDLLTGFHQITVPPPKY